MEYPVLITKAINIIMRKFINIVEGKEVSGRNQYPDAGVNASPEINKKIEDFRNLSDEEKNQTPLLYYILGDGTPPYKMEPRDANYTDNATGEQTCGSCEFSYQKVATGNHICSQIRGGIQLRGWCKLWKPQD